MFAAPGPQITELVSVFDLIPAEHHEEAQSFFRELTVYADGNGITIAEALADMLRPYLKVLRRAMGVEAYEERALTITDTRGNEVSFALNAANTRHLRTA